jgi:hypothetical protein
MNPSSLEAPPRGPVHGEMRETHPDIRHRVRGESKEQAA